MEDKMLEEVKEFYQKMISESKENMDGTLPALVHYMDTFIGYYNEYRTYENKMRVLKCHMEEEKEIS